MKNIIKLSLFLSFFTLFFLHFFSMQQLAVYNERSSEDFKISVGKNGYANVILDEIDEENEEFEEPYKIRNFQVYLNKDIEIDPQLDEENLPQFKWIHEMCFEINGVPSQECEKDEIEEWGRVEKEKITPNTKVLFDFYTDNDKLPYFYESHSDEIFVTFKNTFECVNNCDLVSENDQTQTLDDLTLEIDDRHPYVDHENSNIPENEEYFEGEIELNVTIKDDKSGVDEDNLRYLFSLRNSEEEIIYFSEIDNYFENGDKISYQPHFGTNEDEMVLFLYVLYFDNAKNTQYFSRKYNFTPTIEELKVNEESSIPSLEEGEYLRELNINIDDFKQDIDIETIRYYFGEKSSKKFSNLDNEYTLKDDLVFGEGLDSGKNYYFHLYGEDNQGNPFYLVNKYKFDRQKPNFINNSDFAEDEAHRSVEAKIGISDSLSGVDEENVFYLWTDTPLLEDEQSGDYLNINNPYTSNEPVLLEGVDGLWKFYVLAYDNVGNFSWGYIEYEFDNTPPSLVNEDSKFDTFEPRNDHQIFVEFKGLNDEEEFMCGWFKKGEAPNENMLEENCINKTWIDAKNNVEGKYKLWMLAYDNAGNKTFISSTPFFIDGIPPKVEYSVLDDHNIYLDNNKINISLIDNSDIEYDSLFYTWGVEGKELEKEDLENRYNLEVPIKYPKGVYGEYNLWLKASDVSGNTFFDKLDKTFKIDSEAINFKVENTRRFFVQFQQIKKPEVIAFRGETFDENRIVDVNFSGSFDSTSGGSYNINYFSYNQEEEFNKDIEIVIIPIWFFPLLSFLFFVIVIVSIKVVKKIKVAKSVVGDYQKQSNIYDN